MGAGSEWRVLTAVGLDPGYSARKASFGVAVIALDDARARLLEHARYRESEALAHVRNLKIGAAAIDAPVTEEYWNGQPGEYPTLACRPMEHLFLQKPFQELRLKPGHWMTPRGRDLYAAGLRARAALEEAKYDWWLCHHRFRNWPLGRGESIYEVFPKAWMAMMLDESALVEAASAAADGHHHDELLFRHLTDREGPFERWAEAALDLSFVAASLLREELRGVLNGDERAAVVAALAAAGAARGRTVLVGNARTGHFTLPPRSVWNPALSDRFDEALALTSDVWGSSYMDGILVHESNLRVTGS